MRIAVDLDEVLFPLLSYWLPWVGERLCGRIIQPCEVTDYKLTTFASVEYIQELLNEYTGSPDFLKIPPIDGAVDGIQSWLDMGDDVIIVTGRPEHRHEISRKQVMQHFPDFEIFCCNYYEGIPKSKGAVARENGAEVLIDDQREHVNDAIKHGLRGIWVPRLWQCTTPLLPPAFVARNWTEISQVAHFGEEALEP